MKDTLDIQVHTEVTTQDNGSYLATCVEDPTIQGTGTTVEAAVAGIQEIMQERIINEVKLTAMEFLFAEDSK